MDAIVYKDIGKYAIEERPVPAVENAEDVLVKVLAVSICGSDVHMLCVPPGLEAVKDVILGHECVGEVVAVGAAVKCVSPGDHVIADNNISCGACVMCQSGMPNLCENIQSMGSMVDGYFAKYFVVPQKQLVKISHNVSLDEAVFAEPLNCVLGAVKKLAVVPGDTVLVLGGGPIGLLFSLILKANGAGKVLVSEMSEYRADFAYKSGADKVINPVEEPNLYEKVLEETNGTGADIVVDAVGVLVADAIQCVRKGGQCILFGLNQSKTEVICQHDITMKGITVIGSYIGNHSLQNVANLLESRKTEFAHLITHKLPLEKFDEGLAAMREGKALEVVLIP